MNRFAEFFKDNSNNPKIRYMGFSMAWLGMVVGIGVAVVATVTGTTGLGLGAAGLITASFLLLPVTDINFPKRGYY